MLRIIKGILFLIGLFFYLYLWINLDKFYGKTSSIQFWILIILLTILIICILLDLFSKIEDFIKRLSDKKVAGVYFSSTIHVLIGYIGVVTIMFSILYGTYYVAYSGSENELIKLGEQSFIWLGFSLYVVADAFVLLIYPLMKKLSS